VTWSSLIVKNGLRNTRRTLVTIIAIAISMFVYTALECVLDSMDQWFVQAETSRRICVHHKMGLTFDLPESYLRRIEAMPEVDRVVPLTWYGGLVDDSARVFSSVSVDATSFFEVWPEFVVRPEDLARFRGDRIGCLIPNNLAVTFGWKVGDEIELQGNIRPVDLRLRISGILVKTIDPMAMWFHRNYLEGALGNPGVCTVLWTRVKSFDQIPAFIERVERAFENSGYEVTADTEKTFVETMISMAGNIRLLVRGVGFIVVITIILVAANSVSMSVRERTREVAVMKALGFARRDLLGMVLIESCAIGLAGGIVGCTSGFLFFDSPQVTAHLGIWAGFFQGSVKALRNGILIALLIGFVSGLVPAIRITRLDVAEALRKVI